MTRAKKQSKLVKSLTWLMFASCCLSVASCTAYNPALFQGYDVLNPGPEVTINPIRTTEDGYFVVNQAYLQWNVELQMEIERLRK